MTEKRFTLEIEDDMYYTIFDNQSTDEEDQLYGLDDEQICDLLNEFADENGQVKDCNHTLAQNLIKSLDERIRLERENKQLKKENSNLKEELWEAETEYIHERYVDNPIREEESIKELKEDFKRGYWND